MSDISGLRRDIEEVTQGLPTTCGVAVNFFESGEEVALNGDMPFQLASVVKVPVLVTAMRQVDAGRIRLDDRVELKDSYKVWPSGILGYLNEGLCLTVQDLLYFMITISENSATDMVFSLVGGPEVVNAAMRALGFGPDQINISMTIRALLTDIFGTVAYARTPTDWQRRIKEVGIRPDAEIYRPGSMANVATPRAMNRLFEMIFRGQVASRALCDKALEILLCQNVNTRIPSQLPFGTYVAHKTGTVPGVRDNSGIIYISDSQHVAVTVFTQKEGRHTEEEEYEPAGVEMAAQIDKAMGRIGKLVFDYGRENV
jgi:beta-lactamase class A